MAREFHHALGVSITLPHMRRFKPTPGMPEAEIAFFQGKEARYFGRPDSENPYVAKSDDLAAEWTRGYEDTRK